MPARGLSSISSWRESKASRKLSCCFPFLDICETDVLSDLPWSVFLPHVQQNQVHQWDDFPYHVRQRGEDSVQRGGNASHIDRDTNLSLYVSPVDGDHRWCFSLRDEEAAPHCHNRVKLPLANRGHEHLAADYYCLVLPKLPKEGRICPGVKY